MKHVNLMTGTVRVDDQQAWTNGIDSRVNVHYIRIVKGKKMYVILISQVAFHPLNSKVVGHLGNKKYYNNIPINRKKMFISTTFIRRNRK